MIKTMENSDDNMIVVTPIGKFIVNKNDTGIGEALRKNGIYLENELKLLQICFQAIIKNNQQVHYIDIGSNIGTHVVYLADKVGESGKIFAFEPQRIIFNMLAGNIAVNNLKNVYCYHLAISDSQGELTIPDFSYSEPGNFGAIEFTSEQKENIGQVRKADSDKNDCVRSVAIDDFYKGHTDFIKIKAESMEMNILRGCEKTIELSRPWMLVAYQKSDQSEMRQWLNDREYSLYDTIDKSFLCIPNELEISLAGMDITLIELGATFSG